MGFNSGFKGLTAVNVELCARRTKAGHQMSGMCKLIILYLFISNQQSEYKVFYKLMGWLVV